MSTSQRGSYHFCPARETYHNPLRDYKAIIPLKFLYLLILTAECMAAFQIFPFQLSSMNVARCALTLRFNVDFIKTSLTAKVHKNKKKTAGLFVKYMRCSMSTERRNVLLEMNDFK